VSTEIEHPTTLRCPFCSSAGVDIREAKALYHLGRAIWEYQAHCPNCKKVYRQASPANLLPLEFRPTP
jgi:C4-type Zn-finger protein